MTNVLQLHASAGLYGGESVILALSNALRNRRVHPTVGCVAMAGREPPGLAAKAAEYGLDVECFPMGGARTVSVIARINRVVRSRKIALIHAHGYKSNLLGAIAARMNRIPMVTTNHLYPMMPLNDRKLQLYGQFDVRITARFVDMIVAVSEDIRGRIIGQGVDEKKVMVIENGIDVAAFAYAPGTDIRELRQSLGIPDGAFVVGSLARLTPQKGQRYLLEAAARVLSAGVPAHVIVAGDGPLRQELTQYAEELGIAGSVSFLGFRRDTLALLRAMDVFVLSSIDEGLPMAMLEAMAARVPVVTTRVGDVPKAIADRHSGMLVEPRDSAALADALLYLAGNDKERARFAANAHDTVVRDYSQESMCDKYLAVYRRLLPPQRV